MNLKRIIDIYNIIKDRLPTTYPRPKLAFYEDEECMLACTDIKKEKDESTVYAVVDPETWTINLPLKLTIEYISAKGEEYSNSVPMNKLSDEDIAHTILHEIGHLYAGERYGYGSKKYSNEKYCDRFAERWIKILRKDNLL